MHAREIHRYRLLKFYMIGRAWGITSYQTQVICHILTLLRCNLTFIKNQFKCLLPRTLFNNNSIRTMILPTPDFKQDDVESSPIVHYFATRLTKISIKEKKIDVKSTCSYRMLTSQFKPCSLPALIFYFKKNKKIFERIISMILLILLFRPLRVNLITKEDRRLFSFMHWGILSKHLSFQTPTMGRQQPDVNEGSSEKLLDFHSILFLPMTILRPQKMIETCKYCLCPSI